MAELMAMKQSANQTNQNRNNDSVTIDASDAVNPSNKRIDAVQSLDPVDRPDLDNTPDFDGYPTLQKYANLVKKPERPIMGRVNEMRSLKASLSRPEVSNAFLVGDPGSGKTMLVQGVAMQDASRIYLEVNLAKMAASEREGENGAVQMGVRMKSLFDEAEQYRKNMVYKAQADKSFQAQELVLFMDEFHLIQQLSPAATQAIKPALADSGTRGIKVIAATTYAEFHEFVSPDQALVERLQRINIKEPPRETVIKILKSIAETYGVSDKIEDPAIYDLIVDYSNRYIPANSQPRKSVLILDAMIGWHNAFNRRLDRGLLADVIYESAGVQVTFKVNGRDIQKELRKRVFDQDFAIASLEQRLQTAVADLHDPQKPMSSFLFTGPTGVGKTALAKGLASLIFDDQRALLRFDMSEYSQSSSIDRFREELTTSVWNRSHSIILLDEVEKADASITRLLLQVLDDGRLSDRNGREVSFLNTYIILTTNAGNEIYKSIAGYVNAEDRDSGLTEYDKVIRQSLMSDKSFAPELINRMDKIIPFAPLKKDTMQKIMNQQLAELVTRVRDKHDVTLIIQDKVAEYLVREGLDESTDAGGARGLINRLSVEVTSAVSRYINTHPHVKRVGVVVEGEMAYKNKDQLKSQAKIVVGTASGGRR